MTKGVFFCTWGKRGYGFAAYNQAFSIKHHSPEIPITLLCDQSSIEMIDPSWMWVFDTVIAMPPEFKNAEPGRIKTSLYEYLPYDYNLLLDVDGLAIKDINPVFDKLIEKGGYYYTHVIGKHTIDKGRDFPKMLWAWADDVWEKYKLPEDAVLPATNSSLQFIKKCDESKKLFEQIKKNFEDPIPIDKLRMTWGTSQPDELYLNIALAQLKIDADVGEQFIFFGSRERNETLTEVESNYYFLSIWGNKNFNRPMYTEFYDNSLLSWHRKHGLDFFTKYHTIKNDKHANQQTPNTPPRLPFKPTLLSGVLPISKSVLIDSSKLIGEYKDQNKRTIRITNWLNCSFIEFRGKTFFAYRMELFPFCTMMRIGLCQLDKNLQPIKSTNVLPNIHTNIGNFKSGFHAEDPRLFVYNDELYLSYTDGWNMAQAKINPDTLQAIESFYYSPQPTKQEKNWTFFEADGKLYSVYDVNNHTIFEMDGKSWKKVAQTDFTHGWKWGLLRGGTTPVRIGDKFLAFFHSAKDIEGGKQYFMGCYTFEATFPFRPISISKEPIIAGEWIEENIKRLSNKIYVVFPNGLIRREDSWMVSFGYNDLECRYIEVSDELLKENMVPVKINEFA